MPVAAFKSCRIPACTKYQPCPDHPIAKQRDNKTESEKKFYGSWRWIQASKRFKQIHPLCCLCAKSGKVSAAEVTDHRIPIRAGADPWDESNWQSLCKVCHDQKRAAESRA